LSRRGLCEMRASSHVSLCGASEDRFVMLMFARYTASVSTSVA
jgi:hypothetical protein